MLRNTVKADFGVVTKILLFAVGKVEGLFMMQTYANHQMELYSPRVCYILSKPFMAGAGLWLDIAALQRQEGADARVLLQALKPGNMGPPFSCPPFS